MQRKDYPKTAQRKVAFLGLGVMGFPMAAHLSCAGHDVCVYNRTPAKAEAWLKLYKGRSAPTPRLAAEGADIVFACVGNDDDLRSVICGENGALAGMAPGSIFVDNTTDSANIAREMHALFKSRGIAFIDAPVSGGQAGAENACLTVMAGGDEADFCRVRDVLTAYAGTITYIGPSGSGQLTKMCNQVCIASVLQGLSEALAFAQNEGLDTDRVLAAMTRGSAGSWQMANRGKTMVEEKFDFGFAVKWIRKDLRYTLEEARRNGSSMPITEIIEAFYSEIELMGGARWDTSSLIMRLPHKKTGP